MVSVDVNQRLKKEEKEEEEEEVRAQELCKSRGRRPGLPVPNSLRGISGRNATFEEEC